MAGTNSNYSIILDAVLDLEKIQSKLNSKKYNIEVEANMTGDAANRLRDTNSATRSLEASTGDLTLTYQQFRQVLDSVIDVAGKMYEQVKTLDTAQTEFKKVSDLSGQALDDYTAKLAKMGQSVGRTGACQSLSASVFWWTETACRHCACLDHESKADYCR